MPDAELRASRSRRPSAGREFPGLERGSTRERVALTFDDGPDPDGTPAVLDALDAAGITRHVLRGRRAADAPPRDRPRGASARPRAGAARLRARAPRDLDARPRRATTWPAGSAPFEAATGRDARASSARRTARFTEHSLRGLRRPRPRAGLLVGVGARLGDDRRRADRRPRRRATSTTARSCCCTTRRATAHRADAQRDGRRDPARSPRAAAERGLEWVTLGQAL